MKPQPQPTPNKSMNEELDRLLTMCQAGTISASTYAKECRAVYAAYGVKYEPKSTRSVKHVLTNPLSLLALILYAPFMIVLFCILAVMGAIPVLWKWLTEPNEDLSTAGKIFLSLLFPFAAPLMLYAWISEKRSAKVKERWTTKN
jgi:hypothetical protein